LTGKDFKFCGGVAAVATRERSSPVSQPHGFACGAFIGARALGEML